MPRLYSNFEAAKAPPSKRIRDIRRLLKKEDLPEDFRLQKLNELKQLEDSKNNNNNNNNNNEKPVKSIPQETKTARKYRMVKFFEKRKLLRYIQRTKLKLEGLDETSPDFQTLTDTLDQYNKDIIYIKYYPKDCKYVSLFKGDDKTTISLREKMRTQAEKIAALVAEKRANDANRKKKEESDEDDEDDESDDSDSDEDDDSDDESGGEKEKKAKEDNNNNSKDDFFL